MSFYFSFVLAAAFTLVFPFAVHAEFPTPTANPLYPTQTPLATNIPFGGSIPTSTPVNGLICPAPQQITPGAAYHPDYISACSACLDLPQPTPDEYQMTATVRAGQYSTAVAQQTVQATQSTVYPTCVPGTAIPTSEVGSGALSDPGGDGSGCIVSQTVTPIPAATSTPQPFIGYRWVNVENDQNKVTTGSAYLSYTSIDTCGAPNSIIAWNTEIIFNSSALYSLYNYGWRGDLSYEYAYDGGGPFSGVGTGVLFFNTKENNWTLKNSAPMGSNGWGLSWDVFWQNNYFDEYSFNIGAWGGGSRDSNVTIWIACSNPIEPTITPTLSGTLTPTPEINNCSDPVYVKEPFGWKPSVDLGSGCTTIIPAVDISVPFNSEIGIHIPEIKFCYVIKSWPEATILDWTLPLSLISVMPAAWLVRRLFNL